MSADRTPAPVAVPEGGWQDGDEVTLTSGHVVVRGDETGKWTKAGDEIVTQDVQRGRVVYVHAPRPEPVVAPLTTEAVEAVARIIATAIGCGGDDVAGVDECDPDPSDYHAASAVLAAGYRLVPEDDEDTVRRVRALAESWAEADGETVDDHGLTTLTVTNRLGRTLLAALDGPR